MNMVHHLVIYKSKLYAHRKTLLLTMKVYKNKYPSFLKTEVFTCSKVFKAEVIELME